MENSDFGKHLVLALDLKRMKIDADSILKRIELIKPNAINEACQLMKAIENLNKLLERDFTKLYPTKPQIYK